MAHDSSLIDPTVLVIYTDGAAKGNPGPAGAGAVIYNRDGIRLKTLSQPLGRTTNNVAEYRALILALKEAEEIGGKQIRLYSDSELMVRQLKGEYKVKNMGLRPLYTQAVRQIKNFEEVNISHLPREDNEEANALADQASKMQSPEHRAQNPEGR
ncbi:MAG: ribonuclease HI family protein [bacterium]